MHVLIPMNESGTLPGPVLSFISYKATIQNCSQNTVNEYTEDIISFFKYLIATRQNIKDIDSVDIMWVNGELIQSVRTDEIYGFLLYLKDVRKNGATSRARRLSAVKAFFKYHTVKTHLLKINPAQDIDSPKKAKTLPKYLTLEESVRLLKSVDQSSPTYERDYCILTLFLNCGMRLSELVGINLTDIDDNLTVLRVTGKGNKTRIIYLNDACRTSLVAYIKVRQIKAHENGCPIKDSSKYALFLSGRNQRISIKTVQWMVNRQLELAGLQGRGFSTHKLRHTAATLMYNSGNVDVRTLKDILGHEQLNTTQIYTHVSDEKLKEAMTANPLSQIGTDERTKNKNNKR